MDPLVDPSGLDRLAGEVARCCEEAMDVAARVRSAPPGSDWTGPGADAAREAAHGEARRSGWAADDLERAAALLRTHAEEVRESLAVLRRARAAAEQEAGRRLARLRDLAP